MASFDIENKLTDSEIKWRIDSDKFIADPHLNIDFINWLFFILLIMKIEYYNVKNNVPVTRKKKFS